MPPVPAASVDQTREMLEEAWEYIHGPTPQPDFHDWNEGNFSPEYMIRERFVTFLVVGAYHDAAMMLIEPDWMITYLSELGLAGGCVCELGNPSTSGDAKSDEGARTIPLAIASAAVKVKESE